MKIGIIQLKNNLVLAPIAGISSLPFRMIVREFGAGLCFTEMVSSEALTRNNKKTEPLLKIGPLEKPLGAQLFGADPEVMASAASILENRGFDIIDINAGCPVRKIVRNNAGAALVKNPKLLKRILMEIKKRISVPLTLKFRSGWNNDSLNAIEIAKIAEDSGVDAITLHPRTASQFFKGKANWDVIRQIKKSIKIPVIGNGDILAPCDAIKMMNETGCDGVMIGRGAFGNPWIFRNILRLMKNNGPVEIPLAFEREKVLLRHLDHSAQLLGEKRALLLMRKQYPWYVKNLPGASAFRNTIIQKKSILEIKNEVNKYFSSLAAIEH